MADFLLFREAGAGVRKIAARLVMDGADEVFVQKAELTNSSGEELGTSTVPLSVSDVSSQGTYGQLTDVSSSVAVSLAGAFAAGIPAGARYVLVIPSGAVRYRADGTAPTATAGMPIAAGQAFPIDGDLAQVQLIAQEGAGVTIDVEAKL